MMQQYITSCAAWRRRERGESVMKKRLFAGFAALCMAASLASAAFAETATPETARAEPPQVVEYSASDDATGFSAAAEGSCV